jgi:hypothetical protein
MARCRVCHRELSNPDHIAMGMGPVCAAKAARRASVTDRVATTAGYPIEKYERICLAVARLAEMWTAASQRLSEVRADGGTQEQIAEAARYFNNVGYWYERVKRMERRAARLVAPMARVA